MSKISIILKMKSGSELPAYVELRTPISGGIYTVNIAEEDLGRLADDPTVESYVQSRQIKQPTKTLYEPNAVAHIRTLNVDYAMEILFNEGTEHGWWKLPYKEINEFKEADIIGYDEFGGLVERILLASVQEKG